MKTLALSLALVGPSLALAVGAAEAAERIVFVSPRAKVVSSTHTVTVYRTRAAIQKREGFEVGVANYSCRTTRTKNVCQWVSWEPRAVFAQCALKADRLECRHRLRTLAESTRRRSTRELPTYGGTATQGGDDGTGRRWYDNEDMPERRDSDENDEYPSRDSGYSDVDGTSDSIVLF